MIERNIIARDNYLYHLSQLEYGGSEWNKACDQLLIEAGRLEGKHEENERWFRCIICHKRVCVCAAKPYTDDQLEQLELQCMYVEEPEDMDFYYEV